MTGSAGGMSAPVAPYDRGPARYGAQVIFAEHCACAATARASFEEVQRHGAQILVAERRAVTPPGWREAAAHGAWALYLR